MNSDSPQSPREELEARLTALLLGELSAEEATSLRQAIAQDAELARLHDRLKQAIGLVRETVTSPEQETLASPDVPKLSPERRGTLLAAFKVIRPKQLAKTTRPGFAWRELVAVAAMIVILCLAAAIITPNLHKARSASQRQTVLIARDESWAEAREEFRATPLARGERGRITVSSKPAESDTLGRATSFSDGQSQNDTALPVSVTTPESPAAFLSVTPTRSRSVSELVSEAKSEGLSVAGYALTPPPPAQPPVSMSSAASEAKVSDGRATRRLAAIALPSTGDDTIAVSSDRKNNEGQTLLAAKPASPGDGTVNSGLRRSGEGRGGGSLGDEAKPAEYAGVLVAGDRPGGLPPLVTANAAGEARMSTPAERPVNEGFAYGVIPAPAPAGSVTIANGAKDQDVRFKETDLNRSVLVTNASVAADAFFAYANPPQVQGVGQFGGIGGSGLAANSLQRSEGLTALNLERESLDMLGDRNASLGINGAAGRYYRLAPSDPSTARAKDAVEESKKKLADLPDGGRIDHATGITTLHFDAEGKNIVRDLQRESGVKSDGKPQVAQQSAEGDVAVNKRFKIALPESERGEARENLRVATGPVAISETIANEPATGLPAQRPSDGSLAVGEAKRRQVKESPAAIAPAAQVAATEKPDHTEVELQQGFVSSTLEPETLRKLEAARIEADSKRKNRPQGETTNAGQIELTGLTRELEKLRFLRDKITARVLQEKVDAAIPKSGIVDVIEAAEEQSSKKLTLWERVRGVVGGDVERSARITVQKDAPDIAGISGGQTYNTFDPYWVQTESEKIQSKVILNKVIEQLNLNEAWGKIHGGGDKLQTEETYRLLKKKIDVSSDPKTGLLDIRVKSESPDEAARIANTVAQVYREARREKYQQMTARGAEALSEELVKQDKEIARVEQELERRKKELNPVQADGDLPKLAASAAIPQPEVITTDSAFSTFSLNVSDVSFKLAAASLEKGQMPDPATVRSEEFINAFDYRDPEPAGSAPIAFAWERARYPFAHDRDLLRFSVKTAASGRQPGRPLNLVLLLDNSGSMERADRVRIRQECLRVLAGQLQPQDRVSVVAFARTARLWVDGLPGSQAGELSQRVGGLTPEGGTNLEDAMNLAYQTALRHFLANGVNRVVLLTDGAANLGDVEPESLKKKVEAHRKQGVALDCFGIGWDGLNDELLEALSRNGDGRYGFVNTPEAATTEFASQLAGALKVAASDVKVQVEWNPRRVTAYRQIGYAKHQLKKEQFRDNTVDAAEIGAAEAGNALYTVQVNPRGEGPIGTVRVRFKVPGTGDYREHEWAVPYEGAAKSLEQSSPAIRLAASASAFSEWLVSSPFAAEVTPDKLLAHLSGVPEVFPADPRPKKLEWMIRQAKSVAGQ
jgi:Mg-chelatase subunit ChlD